MKRWGFHVVESGRGTPAILVEHQGEEKLLDPVDLMAMLIAKVRVDLGRANPTVSPFFLHASCEWVHDCQIPLLFIWWGGSQVRQNAQAYLQRQVSSCVVSVADFHSQQAIGAIKASKFSSSGTQPFFPPSWSWGLCVSFLTRHSYSFPSLVHDGDLSCTCPCRGRS